MKHRLVNQAKLSFPALSANEGFARIAAASFASQVDPTIDEIADIKTAVSEAVTNCIVHAYNYSSGIIKMTLCRYDDGVIRIVIKDDGCGIPDIKQAMQPLYTTDKSGERSGMGFAIMKSFMDKLKVTSKTGKGTSVTMEKNILPRHQL